MIQRRQEMVPSLEANLTSGCRTDWCIEGQRLSTDELLNVNGLSQTQSLRLAVGLVALHAGDDGSQTDGGSVEDGNVKIGNVKRNANNSATPKPPRLFRSCLE